MHFVCIGKEDLAKLRRNIKSIGEGDFLETFDLRERIVGKSYAVFERMSLKERCATGSNRGGCGIA